MTEQRDRLAPSLEAFVLKWGSLGPTWGVNRSVSQIHALLYCSEHPLTAEAIAEVLGMARSNVSTSLRELMSWGLVRRAALKADRRDHFEAETDVWEIASLIAKGRKQREVDPALAMLKAGVAEAKADPAAHPVARERLVALLEFTEMLSDRHAELAELPRSVLGRLVKKGAKLAKYLPSGKNKG